MKRIKFGIIIAASLFIGLKQLNARTAADSTGPASTVLRFTCINTSDDSIQLKSTLIVKHEDGNTNLMNATISFFGIEKEQEVLLGKRKTNGQGIAVFKIPVRNNLSRNELQMFAFKAKFDGDSKYESSEAEFGLKPAKLKVSFYLEDTVKFVKVEGTQFNANGSETSIGAADVVVGVPKMFSILKISQISLDSTGIGIAEFPVDIIGDSLGNLTVVASIEENEVFGNITAQATNDWGLKKHLVSPDRPSRELWTPIAPLWMIITLIIMLAGVWGHYIYAVIQLVMIKKSSKTSLK